TVDGTERRRREAASTARRRGRHEDGHRRRAPRVRPPALGAARGEVSRTLEAPGRSRATRRRHGVGGQTSGAGVFGCPTKRRAGSLAALDGGFPLTFAGAAAHHGRSVPRASRTATRRSGGAERSNVQLGPPPFSCRRSARSRTLAMAPVRSGSRNAYPVTLPGLPRIDQPAAGSGTVAAASPVVA